MTYQRLPLGAAQMEALGHDVEGEGDEALFDRNGLARMLHGAILQLLADALSLLAGCNEEFRQEPSENSLSDTAMSGLLPPLLTALVIQQSLALQQ